MSAMTVGTAMLVGMAGSAILGQVMAPDAPDAPAATPPPATPTPTPMALLPQTKQKKTEQTASLASAGAMTPQSTLLSGNEKRSVLGG